MKKVTLTFQSVYSEVGGSADEGLKNLLDQLDRGTLVTHINSTASLLNDGDIWFISTALTEDGLGVYVTFILDSDDALDRFQSESLPGWQAAGLSEFYEENITFEKFASFAAENNETAFNPFEAFDIAG